MPGRLPRLNRERQLEQEQKRNQPQRTKAWTCRSTEAFSHGRDWKTPVRLGAHARTPGRVAERFRPRVRGSEYSQRFQIFHEILFLLISKSQIETLVVAVDNIQQSLESGIVIEAPLILWKHEQATFANE